MFTRRTFLHCGSDQGAAPAFGAKASFEIRDTAWNLSPTGKQQSVQLPARIGCEAVEVSVGRKTVDNKLPLDNAEIQEQYLEAARKNKIRLAGTCLDILHVNYLKNDKLGQKWVADSIPITKKLNAR